MPKKRSVNVGRRTLMVAAAAAAARAVTSADGQPPQGDPSTTALREVAPSASATITVERRDEVVLIGLNRPFIQNRLDPPTRVRLAETLFQYEHDSTLRAAVLFGHGEHFSRGIDVDASQAALVAGRRTLTGTDVIDPLGKAQPRRTKPLVVAAHGDTWNLGHELYLAGDIRVAAANTRFGQDENTHGRFPGGGATVRFVRDAGWGNAMRYMLTGEHWTADESYRMGITQFIAATPEAALEQAVAVARKIAANAPLSIKATLASAHLVIDPIEADALSKLDAQYAALYRTEDFIEGRRAEAEGRPPRYQGK
jgi:enoyl-CoA hydratase/carnithine racemase